MVTNKNSIRQKFLVLKKVIKFKTSKESKINIKLKSLIYTNDLVISSYNNIKSEVNILEFTRFIQKKGKKIVLPSILKVNSHLFFKEWKINTRLILGKFNIKIPTENIFLTPRVLLIPMVAFDKYRNRLGYGGGYYDRTISFLEKENKILKIGIAFDEQQTDLVPTTKFDKKMDLIITPTRIIV